MPKKKSFPFQKKGKKKQKPVGRVAHGKDGDHLPPYGIAADMKHSPNY